MMIFKRWHFLLALMLGIMSTSLQADLRILSYNIKHGRGMDGQVDLQRSAAVIKSCQPDIVALQEVDVGCKRSGGINQPEKLAAMLGPGWHHRFGKFMDYDGGAYGLAILSRYPVTRSKVHPLPRGTEARVALEIEVEPTQENTGAQRLSVVCVHFDYIRDDTARFKQASTLIEALEPRKRPVIVTGDFNDTRPSRTLKAFAKHFTLPPSAGPTFNSVKPSREIDFCVFRGFEKAPELSVIEEKVASDHRPLLSVFPGT